MKRVLFISSTGGHLTELLQLEPLFQHYEASLVTEKTKSNASLKQKYGKRIWIETFANSTTQTEAGKLVYPIADLFIVQWESMLKLYPNAVMGGWIF